MARPARVKITTPFPTFMETAKRYGISKRDAKRLSDMAERAWKTGVYELEGVGRLVRVKRKARTVRNPVTGEEKKIPAKVTFRIVKVAKNAPAGPRKK